MPVADLLPDTVTFQRFTKTSDDDFGNPIGTWANTTGSPAQTRVVEVHRDELRDGQQVSFRRYEAYVESTVDVAESDRALHGGLTLHVVSVAKVWGRTAVHHQKVTLEVAK